MQLKKVASIIMLLLTSMIWGAAFVAQSVSMDYIEPFTFICLRSLIGGVVLLPVIHVFDHFRNRSQAEENKGKTAQYSWSNPMLWKGGAACGLFLFLANCAQQTGIQFTTAGKAGFITALYIILVPIFAWIIFRKKCSAFVGAGVFLGVIGLYLLCISDKLTIEKGDTLIIICAFFFTGQILAIDYFVPHVDGMKMACLEFLLGGILSLGLMFLLEHPDPIQIHKAMIPILYTGIMSTGVAYTLQILAQENLNPTVAALLMSLESVFSVLSGYLILGEILSGREIAGCFIMFAAIILSQIPVRIKEPEN